MKTVKDKLYNYEVNPPEKAWENIASQIGQAKVVTMKSRRPLYFAMAAAAAVVIFLAINMIFFNKDNNPSGNQNAVFKTATNYSPAKKDSIKKNNQILETIIKTPEDKKLIASSHLSKFGFNKKYITISGPEGEPIKISPKAATLIVSADDEYPPKPVWDKKISKWQHIMLTSSVSASPTNLMDILQQASNNVE